MKQPVSPIEPIGELLARLANWTLAIAMAAAFILFGGDPWIERLAYLAAAVVALHLLLRAARPAGTRFEQLAARQVSTGAWVVVLLGLVALNAITGFGMLMIDQARHHGLEEFHELAATTLIVAVFAHLAWMLREALLQGESLARRLTAPRRKRLLAQ